MENINLKYLIIGVLCLSILIVGGAFIFKRINSGEFLNNPISNQTIPKQPEEQLGVPAGGGATEEGSKSLSKPVPISN